MPDQYRTCNWGMVPPNVVVTTSDTLPRVRVQYQEFLQLAVRTFGKPPIGQLPWFYQSHVDGGGYNLNPTPDWSRGFNQSLPAGQPTSPWSGLPTTERSVIVNVTELSKFYLFASGIRYGNATNLLLQDLTTELVALNGYEQTFTGYL
ncbi:hypothetical protein V5799_009649, partial [Amblyomma americanum]